MSDEPQNLFLAGGTTAAAREISARSAGAWRQRILARLSAVPSSTFELAEFFEVPDNRVSGRITDLQRDLYIEPTGERRINPRTGAPAEVWRLARALLHSDPIAKLIEQHYPLSLRIDDDMYDREALLPSESYPGVAYARRADNGGMRLSIRIDLIECPGCGKPLALVRSTGSAKYFGCSGKCPHVFRLRVVNDPGKSPLLALVKES